MDKNQMHPDLRKIVEWIEDRIGGEWELSHRQRQVAAEPLREGVTPEMVIESMPAQMQHIKEKIARVIEGWDADEVEDRSVARIITLNTHSGKGVSGNMLDLQFQMMDRFDIFAEGVEEGRAQFEEEFVESLYTDALGREPDAKGMRDHLKELRAGRSPYQKAIDFHYSKERMERAAAG